MPQTAEWKLKSEDSSGEEKEDVTTLIRIRAQERTQIQEFILHFELRVTNFSMYFSMHEIKLIKYNKIMQIPSKVFIY